MAEGGSATDTVGRVRSRTTAWRLVGILVGAAAGAALVEAPQAWLGLGPALAGPAFAVCVLAGVIAGEVLTRASAGSTRRAVVEVRTPAAFLPRRMLVAVAVFGVLLAALLVTTSVVASADDQGRWGRALTIACTVPTGTVSTSGPWPGVFYSVPIGLTVLIGLITAGLAARAVAVRPRPGTAPGERRDDDLLRRDSARAITAAMGVVVAAPLAGSSLVAWRVLARIGCEQPDPLGFGAALLVLTVVAAVATAGFVAVLVRPSVVRKGEHDG